ncbi:MAG: HD domain-containing protein [Planctomycetes bacterium]|nr:HD domain-containing protein [Planctomycetota bacterium]
MDRPPTSPLDALLALVPLESLPRTGWVLRGVAAPETIAGHILNTCYVVLALGPRVEPAIDVERAVVLATLHDAPEALTGDLPRMVKSMLPDGAKAQAEEHAARALLDPLPPSVLERWREYRDACTREARFVRVCDRLQMGVRAVAYRRLGLRGLDDFEVALRELDCGEFAPARALREEILAALRA